MPSIRSDIISHSSRTFSGAIRTVTWALRNLPCGPELRPAGVHLVEDRFVDVARRPGRREQLGRDPDRVRDRAVGLLAAVAAFDALDQPDLEQCADVEVEVPGVDLEALRELAIRERLVVLAEELEHSEAERMAERLQLLGLVDREDAERGSSRVLGRGP